FSISLMSAMALLFQKQARRSALFAEIILPMAAVALIFAVGYRELVRPERASAFLKLGIGLPELTVALIQPSIPQSMIWDENENDYRFKQLIKLSEDALTNNPDIVLWPEAAV